MDASTINVSYYFSCARAETCRLITVSISNLHSYFYLKRHLDRLGQVKSIQSLETPHYE